MTEDVLLTPEQYADLVIRDVETAHLARKDDFLGVASYRDEIIKTFKSAILTSYRSGQRAGAIDYEKRQMEALKGTD